MIELKQVTKSYKQKTVLKDISLLINSGESIGIIGPNGAGKSTFLKLLASIEKPDMGKILYDGVKLEKVIKPYRQDLGYIPQEIALYEELTVKEQIKFWQKLSKVEANSTFVEKMLQMLRLNEVMNKRVSTLSGGWRRKVNLCVGMLHHPQLLLLDEPTSGIDLAAKEDIITWLKALHEEGVTIIYISHDWYELNKLSKRIIIIDNGELKFTGPAKGLDEFEKGLSEENEELRKILRVRH